MKKILYLLPRFPTLSETFIAEEIIAVRARGYDVKVISLSQPRQNELAAMGSRLRELSSGTVYLKRIPVAVSQLFIALIASFSDLNNQVSRRRGLSVRGVLRCLRAAAVASYAKRTGADMIYAHWPQPSEVALLAGHMSGLPVALSIHAHEVAHDNAHFPAAFKAICFAAFCNAAAMRYLLNLLPPDVRQKGHLVYHGVDFTQFPYRSLPSPGDSLRVVSAGRLTPTKGMDRLVECVAKARAKGANVHLTIVGEGSGRDPLMSKVDALGLGDAVQFTGWMAHERIGEEFAKAHLFVLLADTNFHDGLPNVVLEAMATGRPAILSPLPAAAEVVTSGVNGVILAEGDYTEECADLFVELSSDSATIERWGAAAAQAVRDKHDRTVQIDKLCTLFDITISAHD